MVTGVGNSAGNNGLKDMLRLLQNGEGNAQGQPLANDASVQVPAMEQQVAASSGVMSNNFASAGGEESRYIKATMTASKAENDMTDRQDAILGASLAGLSAAGGKNASYANRILGGKKAEQRMLQDMQRAATDASERNLKEIKKGIEDTAQEAIAPVDENGNPVATPAAEGAGEAVPVSGSGEVAVAGDGSAPAETGPVQDAAAVAQASATVPATPSVDLMV